jgi:hypothetical protein
MKLDLVREPVGALGGMGGRGAKNVLGAPKVGVLETVVREAVQNSWDARSGKEPVRFRVDAYSLSRSQRQALATALSDGLKQDPPVLELPSAREDLDAIVISDRCTSGLGGEPTADAADGKDGDFARFVFSIGETKLGTGQISAGGTYGFGRSAFLDASACGTILVHTVCKVPGRNGATESRFIAMHWGKAYRLAGTKRRFAGRHWWGVSDHDGVLPLTGSAADRLVESIGITIPDDGKTGTTIMILQPKWSMADGSDDEDADFDIEEARKHARKQISQALLWYVWPRIHDRSLEVSIGWFGTEVLLPAPATHSRLKLFVRALELAQKQREPRKFEHAVDVDCRRPIQALGYLGLAKRIQVVAHDDDHLDPTGPMHHVALMRDTRLVVQYLRCAPAADRWEYAGVFVTDSEVDRIFAKSEPPTHDDWSKEKLRERSHRVFVNVALKRVTAEARAFGSPGALAADGGGSGLGPIADALGSILADVTGPSTSVKRQLVKKSGRHRGEGGGGGTRLPSGVRVELGVAERDEAGERRLLRIPFSIEGGPADATVSARAAVIVEGGATESEAPEGSMSPEILGWELKGTSARRKGAVLKVPAEETLEGTLVVIQPADCTVRVAIDPVR